MTKQTQQGAAFERVSSGRTHVGKVRPTNQDAILALDASGLWVVADGMGGYRDGDVASRMVCEALADLSAGATLDESIAAVRTRLQAVNLKLYKAATRVFDPVVSGSTVAVLAMHDDQCAAIWAGDSRVYRLRARQLDRLTTDHTIAAQLNLQSDEAAHHAITRAVGGDGRLVLDVHRDRIERGDRYLLCTDGLTHEVGDTRIAELLAEGDPATCADALIEAALAEGGRDNVSVIVIDVR